jgi:hypothetical protein
MKSATTFSRAQQLSRKVRQVTDTLMDVHNLDAERIVQFHKLGSLLTEIRLLAEDRWYDVLKELEIEPYRAQQLISVACSWWSHESIKNTEMLAQLPADLDKLYWASTPRPPQQYPADQDPRFRVWAKAVVRGILPSLTDEDFSKREREVRHQHINDFLKKLKPLVEALRDLIGEHHYQLQDPIQRCDTIMALIPLFDCIEVSLYAKRVSSDDFTYAYEQLQILQLGERREPQPTGTPDEGVPRDETVKDNPPGGESGPCGSGNCPRLQEAVPAAESSKPPTG